MDKIIIILIGLIFLVLVYKFTGYMDSYNNLEEFEPKKSKLERTLKGVNDEHK